MLSAEGCHKRRLELWERIGAQIDSDHVRLADPMHLIYLANFHIDPISLNAGFGGVLLLRKDGRAKLLHDDRVKAAAAEAHVEEKQAAPWYDGQSPGRGPRQLALVGAVNPSGGGLRFHDRPGDPDASAVTGALASMRRRKDADELALLRRCMRAGEAGHARARAEIKPGMTELDVYSLVCAACTKAAGRPVIV